MPRADQPRGRRGPSTAAGAPYSLAFRPRPNATGGRSGPPIHNNRGPLMSGRTFALPIGRPHPLAPSHSTPLARSRIPDAGDGEEVERFTGAIPEFRPLKIRPKLAGTATINRLVNDNADASTPEWAIEGSSFFTEHGDEQQGDGAKKPTIDPKNANQKKRNREDSPDVVANKKVKMTPEDPDREDKHIRRKVRSNKLRNFLLNKKPAVPKPRSTGFVLRQIGSSRQYKKQ